MTLAGLMEGLGLGAARDAKRLVARLAGERLRVATGDEAVVRALAKAGHAAVALAASTEADSALALALPDGDAAIGALDALVAATKQGGTVMVGMPSGLGQEGERARVAGLFLRAGLVELEQRTDRGLPITRGIAARRA